MIGVYTKKESSMYQKLFLFLLSTLSLISMSCPTCPEQFSKESPPFFLQTFPEDQLFSVDQATPLDNPHQFTTEDGI